VRAVSEPLPAGVLQLQNEEAFRRLVEGVEDYAVFMLTPEGIVATWNLGAQRIKGYQPAEIIGKHFSHFYPQEATAKNWPAIELEHARELGRFEDEGWRIRKDGSRFWANVVITAFRGADGKLLGFSKITRDLTERRRQEELLRERGENLALLIEGVKDHAIFMLDADGAIRDWNAGAQRVHGFPDSEVVGRSLTLLYTAEDQAAGRPAADLAKARAQGACEVSGWRMRQDGGRFWADVTITAVNHADGSLRGFVHVTHDVTERRRVQELETEGRRINEFIAMLAHELRNPLAPIGNAVGILEKIGHTSQLQWCAQLIGRQVSHLSRLVDDLLDVSRITSGKIQLRREPLELGTVINVTVESVQPLMQRYNHTFDVVLPQEPLHMQGDATRLTQMLVNLLTNAAKYTPNGGRIELRMERQGPAAHLHVVDNGIGMPRPLLHKAFDLFVQGEQALDRPEGGLGIGLTLVKHIAEMHQGHVTAASDGPGRGTRMTVVLPLALPAARAQEPPLPAQAATQRRVLVVDDSVDAAHSLAALLRMSGHSVMVAHDGAAALQLAAATPPDVMLLDIGLPGISGYEVARRARALPALAQARLIAMTGYGREDDRRESVRAGFDMHLVKPVDPNQLLRIIEAPGP
jgi:PAS domain S-box-containing protein